MSNEHLTIGVETREGYEMLKALVAERDQLKAQVDAFKRNEFVCMKCGLRKDSDPPSTDPLF